MTSRAGRAESSGSRGMGSASRKLMRSSSMGQQPCLVYNKMLKPEAQYCIFTTRETSRSVLASDTPYSGKLLNDSLRTPNDV